jgi:hypothetical protein
LAALGLVVAALGLAVRAFTVPLVRLAADRLAALLAGLAAAEDLAAVLDARAAGLDARAAVLDARAAGREALAAVPEGRAADRDRAVVPDDLVADRDLVVVPDDLVADRDLEAGLEAVDALGAVLACDMVFAAAVSDLAAVVMALVAVFIACMAVDIVLAEDVALVAAAVILVAAEVTFVAADETVLAATAVDGELAELVERVDLAPPLLLLVVLALRCGRLAARVGVLLLVDLVRALAEVRRAVVRVVVRAGTDLPPSRSITEVLFHEQHRFTHLIAAYLQNNGRKQTKIAAISPREVARTCPHAALRRRSRRRRRAREHPRRTRSVARSNTRTSADADAGRAVAGRVGPPPARLGPVKRVTRSGARPCSRTVPPGRPSLAGPGRQSGPGRGRQHQTHRSPPRRLR